MSALPEHVSGITPIGKHLDGDRPFRTCPCPATGHLLDCDEHGLAEREESGAAEVLVLTVPTPPKRETYWKNRRRSPKPTPPLASVSPIAMGAVGTMPKRVRRTASRVTVHTADPRCWALVIELGWDPARITIETDGSVILHNSPEQAQAWRRKGT